MLVYIDMVHEDEEIIPLAICHREPGREVRASGPVQVIRDTRFDDATRYVIKDDHCAEYAFVDVQSKKEVCARCQGEGTCAADGPLGGVCFAGDDLREAQADHEFWEAYRGGQFDGPCRECKGLRVVDVPDLTQLTDAERGWIAERENEESDYHRMCDAERRMGC